MPKVLRRLLCRHIMCWSDRRQGEVCYKCGKFRSAMTTRMLTLPDRGSRRTISIRFPTMDEPGRTDLTTRFSRPRTAMD